MTTAPRVSVIIPTCNRRALLEEAVASVRAQTFRDYEILICDDGSTDDTCTRAPSLGPAVRYLQLAHAGRPGPPRNRGIEAARGELIAFLDDDDLWEPDKLHRQLYLFDRDPGLGVVYSDRRLVNFDGSHRASAPTPSPPPSGELLDLLLAGHLPCICTLLVRSDLLRRVGGFDESLDYSGEDLDLCFRLARITRAARVPEPLAIIRYRRFNRPHPTGPLDNAITVFERQLEAGDLRVSQRLCCHAMLARLNGKLAANRARAGDRDGARRAALRALRHRPMSARSWARLVQSSLPGV